MRCVALFRDVMRGWCFLVLLVGAASAEHNQAWKTDTEYQYLVRGRTLAAMHDITDQYTGVVMKAMLTIQPKHKDTLEAKISRAQYAQIHTKLPHGWDSDIQENMLDMKQFPMSDKVFEIKMKRGVVRDLIVDKDVPTWEVNVLKSFISQLQVDTQGENMIPSRYNQEPEGNYVNAMYKTMEDSVGGKCEVLYDISPLPEFVAKRRSDLLPMPEILEEGQIIDIVKSKNYSNCEQRVSHHFGITGSNDWEPGSNDNGKFLGRSSISRIVITGDLKTFTIQSSVTTNKVIVSPFMHQNQNGMVSSRVNLTLIKMGPVSSGSWSTSANSQSTGNLVYSFNNPFAESSQDRRPGAPMNNFDPRRDSAEERRNRYSQDKRQDDDLSASQDSKIADSLESNEGRKFWQPKPTLNEAPFTPLHPFFIGIQGKSIHRSGDVDAVMSVKSLSSQIGSEFQDPNSITDEQTLEKFTILVRIIQTMNTQQIAEAQRELYQSANEIDPHDENQSVRRSTWVAFRDAVAQAGTGPALVTIKNWIKERKIKGSEAAFVVGVLSNTARTPTPEYMDTFFEMVKMPETINDEHLIGTAMVVFAELVRYSQVNEKSAHNRYPVHSFGRLSPKDNPAVLRDYLPYMAEQLKTSIENNELAKSHVFIRSLGNVAHPKILSIFEPYLEGKMSASNFQRLLMVFSMDKLAALKPRLARGVFYRIYQNTAEAHELRCAAVTLLMTTDPPASMLQRMAEFTNYDYNKHVNGAVKSAIESASELVTPEWRELARKARNARSLLNKDSYGFEFSRNYLSDYMVGETNIAMSSNLAFIGSDDSLFPRAFYTSIKTKFGDFKVPKTQMGALVSSVKDLNTLLREQFKLNKEPREKSSKMEFSPDNIAKLLKIEAENKENVEGAFWETTMFMNRFMSFDKHSIERMSKYLLKAAASLADGRNFNMAGIESYYDASLSFPMESGLPFVYTMKIPHLMKLSGSAKGILQPHFIDGSADLRFVYSMQVQPRLGFVAPFENQHYMAGINRDIQLYVPLRAEVKYDKADNRMTLKIEPIEKNEKYKLLHYSNTPFTSRHDILSMTPVLKDKETHISMNGKLEKTSSNFGSRTRGLYLEMEDKRDSWTVTRTGSGGENWAWELLCRAMFPIPEEKSGYRKTDIYMVPNPSSEQSIILTGAMESLHDDRAKYDEKRSRNLNAEAPHVKDKGIKDEERRKELLRESVKDIAAADASAIDFGVEMPGQEPSQWFMTIAYANSKVDEKSRGLAYWRLVDAQSQIEFESCASLESRSPRAPVFDLEMAKTFEPKSRKFEMDLRFGDNCQKGSQIRIRGGQEQTDKYRDMIKILPIVSECMKELKAGTSSMQACQDVKVKSGIMDNTNITIELDTKNRDPKTVISGLLDAIYELVPDVRSMIRGYMPKNEQISENSVKLVMNFDPSTDAANFAVMTPELLLATDNVEINPLGSLALNINPDLSISERLNMKLSDINFHHHHCMFDADWATTFDQATYPVVLGRCWHVAMTTFPRNSKDRSSNEKITEDMKVTVLVRDADDNNKDVKVTLGNKEIELMMMDSKTSVTLDGNRVDLRDKLSYRQKNGEDIEFEIFKRGDDSIQLFSSKYDIDITYNGQRVHMKASDKYRNDIRGLCGNYDGEPSNDFTSPKDCVLSKPAEFAASYAMRDDDCQGPSVENWRKAEEAVCNRKSIRPGNVISDREAGRNLSKNKNWGFHDHKNDETEKHNESGNNKRCTKMRTKVIEEDDQTCFSLRPVPDCASGCGSTRTKPKVMPLYCMPNGAASKQMADRIRHGANPDLSQKKPTKKLAFDIPVGCHVL